MRILAAILLGLCVFPAPVMAQEDATIEETGDSVGEYDAWAAEFEAGLDRKTGSIDIVNGQVRLTVPEQFYFLDKEDTRAVLEEAWGNPPDDSVDGMVFPAKYSPLDSGSWGAILTFIDDGYVSDEDADSIDYDQLMREMQKGTEQGSAEREKLGFGTVELIGWAEPPVYDQGSNKLYWAKELKFEASEVNTLNYDVRILGRFGIVSMNFVATIDQLEEIKGALPAVLDMVEYTEGYRYADYRPGDKKADYGLAALVAGGAGLALAKKTGILGVLLIALKKFGIFILIGIGAVFAWLRRKVSGNS